jgi:hypothetical protein
LVPSIFVLNIGSSESSFHGKMVGPAGKIPVWGHGSGYEHWQGGQKEIYQISIIKIKGIKKVIPEYAGVVSKNSLKWFTHKFVSNSLAACPWENYRLHQWH